MSDTATTRPSPEALVRRICDKHKEFLTFGYIGNFERWGDDRLLFIWVKGLRYKDGNRNQKYIWQNGAKDLTYDDVTRASAAVNGFMHGMELQKQLDNAPKNA